MKKKLIIAISSIVVLVGLVLLLAFTVFSLKSVTLDFRTSKEYITATNEEIIKNAKFKMKSSVLCHDKSSYIKNMEDYDPYIKVINIETKFPSSFVVHIAERQEVYAVAFDGGHYICDEELRVLRIDESYSSTAENAMFLAQEGISVKSNYKVGEYISNMRKPEIYNVLYGANRPLGEQKALIESVTLSKEYSVNVKKDLQVTTLKYFSGQTFKIINDSYGLEYKVKLMNDVYTQIYDFIGKTIKDKDKNLILLTEDKLKNCTIIIDNYYNYQEHKESECWFDIIINDATLS